MRFRYLRISKPCITVKKQAAQPHVPARPVDKLLKEYANAYPPGAGRTLQIISAYIMLLGLLGLCWALPFPYIHWLGSNNGIINWASVLMAVVVYAYYRLWPVLSYLVLMVMFVFSYAISQSELWQKAGGPQLTSGSALVLLLGFMVWFISCKITTRQELLAGYIRMLFIAPLWPFYLLFKKQSININ